MKTYSRNEKHKSLHYSQNSVPLSDLGGAVGIALKVGTFTPVARNGAEDGGDVDDGCSVDAHAG